jgi:predicted nucleic acid-binding protein
MIGVDTSFLVALTAREHPSHRVSWRLFEKEIRGGTATMAVAAQVLAEFCHVITDPRRFERPLDMRRALDLCEAWWHSRECRRVVVDEESGTLFMTWMHQHRLGRKRILDTLLAASYHLAGVRQLATTDWRDFSVYGVFDVVRL